MKRNEDQSTDMPAIVLRPISSLIRYAKNARTHSPEQVREIAASIREFGWVGSVLADADGLVAGLVEFDPKFVDVIVARWEEYTGRKAELETKVVN